MKIKYTLCFCLLLSFHGFGQRLFPAIIDTNKNIREINIDFSAEIASTALDNQILNRILFGGEISDKAIFDNSNRQKLLNRGGSILAGTIQYTDLKVNLFKQEKLGFGIQYGYDQIASISYSDHLFNLAAKGNKEFAGSTADISSTTIRNFAFQKLGFGVILKPTKSSLFLNVVGLSNYFKGGIGNGFIRQSENLDTVTIKANGNFAQPNSQTYLKGMGLSLDFNYNIPINFFKNDHAILQAQVRNLGVVYVDKGVKHYRVDSTYNYTGFSFEQLFNGGLTNGNLLDTLGIKREKSSKWIALPFYVQLSKAVNEEYEGKFQSLFGLRVYPVASYRPLVYVGADYKPIANLHLGLMASYGGFSTFRGTFYLQYKTPHFGFGIGIDNIVGSVYKKGLGQTYNIQLICRF